VVGDFDAHFGVDGGLVGRVGLGEGGRDVAQRCDQGLDVFFGEPGCGLAGEEGFEPAACAGSLPAPSVRSAPKRTSCPGCGHPIRPLPSEVDHRAVSALMRSDPEDRTTALTN